MRDGHMRVFLSHTAEMREFPHDRSFVAAAEAAVMRVQFVVTDMAYFAARDERPSDHCRQMVREADVFVGIIGLRYGTPVPDRPDVSFTELEFQAATECGIPRLMFLLDDRAVLPLPAAQLIDHQHGRRQADFRRHVEEAAGVMAVRFASAQQLEDRLFQALARLAQPDVETRVERLRRERFADLVRVHPRFDDQDFARHVESASNVAILNTWIPNLGYLADALVAALTRRAEVRILLLHPYSPVATLRDDALGRRKATSVEGSVNVRDGVERNLEVLRTVAGRIDRRRRGGLKVKVFNSLPSASIYRADDRYLVGTFLHNQLAIQTPQLEIHGPDTMLAGVYQRELDTVWGIGSPVDPFDWRRELDLIRS